MSFDRNLLDIVCCPVTRLPLEALPHATLERLNARIAAGALKNCANQIVDEPLEDALMTRDGRLAYPVRDGGLILLEEQGILLAQIDDA